MKKLTLFLVATTTLFQTVHAQNTSPYWSLAGNSNASTSSKLGTTNAIPLRLMTKNTERLRIDTFGRVGIGLTTIKSKFSILNNGSKPATAWVNAGTPLFTGFAESTAGNADYILSLASNTVSARPVYMGRRSRGTLATPSVVSANDLLASMLASGFDGTAFQNPATIDFLVDGTPTAGNVPTRLSFVTGSNSSNRTERLRIAGNGNISFNANQMFIQKATGNVGIGTSNPTYKLEVNGEMSVTNTANTTDAAGIRANGAGYGVFAEADGVLDPDDGYVSGGTAVWGEAFGNYGTGVRGEGSDSYGTGVVGIGADEQGTGVLGQGNTGVIGQSSTNEGIGVQGDAFAASGIGLKGSSLYSIGVYGTTSNASSYAGYFNGNVFSTGSYLPSARKLKQNITDLKSAMTLIAKLHPKEYEYKQEGIYKLMHLPGGRRYGLIAEEIEEVLPTMVKETTFDSRLIASVKQNPGNMSRQKGADTTETLNYKAVNYIELIPILVKGLQEQDQKIQEQQQQNEALKDRVEKLEELVSKLINNQSATTTIPTSAYLEQNTPNPVNFITTIRYHVPENTTSARLNITDAKGQLVKTMALTNRSGQVNLNTSMLTSGNYNYTLFVEGKPADTKRLVVAR